MWFKLNTTFTTSLGTLSELSNSWSITRNLTNYSTTSTTTSVTKGGKYSATFTLNTGCTYSSHKVTMGGTDITSNSAISFNSTSKAITITNLVVTGALVITAVATGASSGGTGGDSSGGGGTTIPTTTLTYTSRQSSSGISKTTGGYLSSGTGYVNVYDNIDASKVHYATSYAPGSSGDNACVCYYTSDGTFISAESGSDWGISSTEYTNQELTIPSNAYTIKLFGRTNNQEAILSVANLTLIAHSAINEKSNLTKSNGVLGASTSGVVKTYNNIDTSKTYLADGFCPNSTGTAAFVCYYDNAGTFISAQDGNDFGLSSQAASKVTLTIPSSTATIKLFGQSGSSDPYLYISD